MCVCVCVCWGGGAADYPDDMETRTLHPMIAAAGEAGGVGEDQFKLAYGDTKLKLAAESKHSKPDMTMLKSVKSVKSKAPWGR